MESRFKDLLKGIGFGVRASLSPKQYARPVWFRDCVVLGVLLRIRGFEFVV